jgi:hypothetical protein
LTRAARPTVVTRRPGLAISTGISGANDHRQISTTTLAFASRCSTGAPQCHYLPMSSRPSFWPPSPCSSPSSWLEAAPVQRGAVMSDHEKMLAAVADSLRSVVSIRDYLIAAQTGAEIAVGMLDRIENRLIETMEAINEDYRR